MPEQLTISMVPSEEIKESTAWRSSLEPTVRGFKIATISPEEMISLMLKRAAPGNEVLIAGNAAGDTMGLFNLERFDNDARGKIFYNNLKKTDLQLYEKLLSNGHAFHVNGIVVRPDLQQQGIGRMLMNSMWEKVRPSLLCGFTKNPSQAKLRAQTAREASYATFLGKTNITDSDELGKPIPDALYDAYLACLGEVDTMEVANGFIYLRQNSVGLEIPSTETFSPNIGYAFEPLIQEQIRQQALLDGKPVLLPLLSIPQKIIDG